MEPRVSTRPAIRITAALAVLIAIAGLVLLFGARQDDGIAGIGAAFQTLLAGALLVTAALVGLGSALLWLLGARRARRLR
jgi:hypothetical protein